MKTFLVIGAVLGFLSVAIGAFGAHALDGRVPEKYLGNWQTGVTYQMFHTGAIFVVAILIAQLGSSPLLTWAGWLFVIGIVIFSGSLYVLTVTQISILGAITPIGGVAFLVGWVLLLLAAIR
ncbi:DUF423 domain-containing protein [Bacillus fonticola]|uniref:DUF423 domain-containing protein n=1 Tax=Bacillus fonticola TaxID=2728853 RepID=UPI001474BDC6|nr:DUF423 domain-containing protein [Bacillus fonticola]